MCAPPRRQASNNRVWALYVYDTCLAFTHTHTLHTRTHNHHETGRAYLYHVANQLDLSTYGNGLDADGVKLYCAKVGRARGWGAHAWMCACVGVGVRVCACVCAPRRGVWCAKELELGGYESLYSLACLIHGCIHTTNPYLPTTHRWARRWRTAPSRCWAATATWGSTRRVF